MRNLLLTVVSLALVVLVLEMLIPDKYSSTDIHRSALYKKRFSSRLDWVTSEFRERNPDALGIVKGLDRCPPRFSRVLVIGDSFVYGKGAPVSTTWDAQLAHLVRTSGANVCVIAIGKNGWSTMDQLDYLRSNWDLLHPDYVIWGYVTNDPDFGDIRKMYWFKYGPEWCHRVYQLRLANLISQKVCFILQVNHPTIGYSQWEALLHQPANLKRYRKVLESLRDFLRQKQVPVHFLLTRKSWEYRGEEFHARVGKLMSELGIPYTDTLPMITRFFSPYPEAFRWTHPGDGHPSALVNAFFAWHGYDRLCEDGLANYKCDEFRARVIEISD